MGARRRDDRRPGVDVVAAGFAGRQFERAVGSERTLLQQAQQLGFGGGHRQSRRGTVVEILPYRRTAGRTTSRVTLRVYSSAHVRTAWCPSENASSGSHARPSSATAPAARSSARKAT